MSCEELGTLGLSGLENRRDDLMALSNFPKRGSAEQGVGGLFSLVYSDRAPGNALNCNFSWALWSKKTTAHCNETAPDAEFCSFLFFLLILN